MRREEDAERYRRHPIFGTDFTRPPVELVTDVRRKLLEARNKVNDLQFGYPGLSDRITCVEGLLTCGVIALYCLIEEMKGMPWAVTEKTL